MCLLAPCACTQNRRNACTFPISSGQVDLTPVRSIGKRGGRRDKRGEAGSIARPEQVVSRGRHLDYEKYGFARRALVTLLDDVSECVATEKHQLPPHGAKPLAIVGNCQICVAKPLADVAGKDDETGQGHRWRTDELRTRTGVWHERQIGQKSAESVASQLGNAETPQIVESDMEQVTRNANRSGLHHTSGGKGRRLTPEIGHGDDSAISAPTTHGAVTVMRNATT
jgi:hypothetical protein